MYNVVQIIKTFVFDNVLISILNMIKLKKRQGKNHKGIKLKLDSSIPNNKSLIY